MAIVLRLNPWHQMHQLQDWGSLIPHSDLEDCLQRKALKEDLSGGLLGGSAC